MTTRAREDQRLEGHTCAVNSSDWPSDGCLPAPAGDWFASAGTDGFVRMWNGDAAILLEIPSDHGIALCAVWSPGGSLLASGSGSDEESGGETTLRVWRVTAKRACAST